MTSVTPFRGRSALVSGAALNYFFTEPRYSFSIAEPKNVVTVLAMVGVGVMVVVLGSLDLQIESA